MANHMWLPNHSCPFTVVKLWISVVNNPGNNVKINKNALMPKKRSIIIKSLFLLFWTFMSMWREEYGNCGDCKGKRGEKKEESGMLHMCHEWEDKVFPPQEPKELKEENMAQLKAHMIICWHCIVLPVYTTVQHHTELMSCENTTELSSVGRTWRC